MACTHTYRFILSFVLSSGSNNLNIIILLVIFAGMASKFLNLVLNNKTLTLKMTTAQVVETSVPVNNNSPIQGYVHLDNQTQPFEMTPGLKPFTSFYNLIS